MDLESLKLLAKNLNIYSDKVDVMKSSNFSLTSVKTFKKYHNALHLQLIEFVKIKKEKNLSELVKQFKGSKEIFKHTDKWIGILSLAIVFLGILLIYMYTIDVTNTMMISTTSIIVIIIFLLIRKVQKQPRNLIEVLNINKRSSEKIIQYIKNIS